MKTHQEHPGTSLVFYGVRRGVGTTTLAVNVATLLGIVARRRTLLLDLSGNEVRASTYLGVSEIMKERVGKDSLSFNCTARNRALLAS